MSEVDFIRQVFGDSSERLSCNVSVNLVLREDPSSLDDRELLAALDKCLGATVGVYRAAAVVRYITGLVLNEIHKRRHIWEGSGTFDAFIRERVSSYVGLSPRSLYQARRIAESWPGLDPEEVSSIGITKLDLLARVTNSKDPGHHKVLEKAKEMSLDELRRWISDDMSYESKTKVLRIPQSLYDELAELSKNAKVQAIVGGGRLEDLIAAAIGEARSAWGV